MEAVGGASMVASVSKRAAELAEAALPDERSSIPASSLMGFPRAQSSFNALRRAEVGGQ